MNVLTDSFCMWKDMEANPQHVLKQVRDNGGYPALLQFVKGIAVSHKIWLDVFPISTRSVDRWKQLAKGLLKEILPHNPSEDPDAPPSEQYISQGIVKAHTRKAYVRVAWGKEVIVRATLVNPSKFDEDMLSAMQRILVSYNKKVVDVARATGRIPTTFPEIAGWTV